MVAQLDKRYLQTGPGRVYSRLVSYALFEGRPLTTRGRWINPLLQWQFERIARRKGNPSIDRPIFILGTGRAGTTILGKILSLHHEVGWLNEPKLMWHVARRDEDLNGNYTDAPARYRLTAADADEIVTNAMHNLYRSYLRASGNSRVLDKYPELVFRVPFVKAIFPDARFIFLVRNGYDTCRSIDRWSQKNGSRDTDGPTDWWGRNNRKWRLLVEELVPADPELSAVSDAIAALTDHTHMAAVEWLLTMREGLALLKRLPDACCRVDYEELTQHPRNTLERVSEFCELAPDPVVQTFAAHALTPRQRGAAFELPHGIAKPFRKTLEMLGYEPE